MKFFNKKFIVVIVVLLVGVSFWLAYINGIFTPFIEKITNETPEAKINAYIQAIANDKKATALNVWEISSENNLLKERRETITDELISAKIAPDFKINSIEWWSTCCVPSVTNNPRAAGMARVNVELADNNGNKYNYFFDVFVPGGYEGGLVGYPVRHWALRDVYKAGDNPLFWTRKSGEL